MLGERVLVELQIDREKYEAELRSTVANDYVWVSPDLYKEGAKYRLADVLLEAGFQKNEKVELKVDGTTITLGKVLA